MIESKLAPIVLFAYNRVFHLKKTIDALKKNLFADKSDLIIFSDGPRTKMDVAKVEEVRNYLNTIKGFRSVTIYQRERNYGLANNIIQGVTEVINQYGKAIVLEDDIITSPYFLKYMNEALDFYENQEKVMHISGYIFPIDSNGLPDTFFIKPSTCWGWATWKRAWQKFEKAPAKQIHLLNQKQIFDFNMNGTYDYWSHLLQNFEGKINTWAIFWYLSIYLNGGFSLHPSESLTLHIGYDTGEHFTNEGNDYDVQLSNKQNWYFPDKIEENFEARKRVEKFFIQLKRKWELRSQMKQQKNKSILNNKPTPVLSPITGKPAIFLTEYDVRTIILKYRELLNINVEYYFNKINKIQLYLCPDTDLMFFYPSNFGADSNFYKKLSEISWYGVDWKWEHQIAFDRILCDARVLEIGCGSGTFLKKLLTKQCKVTGLEKTPTISSELEPNFDFFVEDIVPFSKRFISHFDYICSFQTLQHFSNIKDFINACVSMLKPEGKLIFSVPNQESFISLDFFNPLNLPPHHLTRWTNSTFKKISNFFQLKLTELHYEPLQEYHTDWLRNIISSTFKEPSLVKALNFAIITYRNQIRGHTILGVFEKRKD